jgi:hypothetical protein
MNKYITRLFLAGAVLSLAACGKTTTNPASSESGTAETTATATASSTGTATASSDSAPAFAVRLLWSDEEKALINKTFGAGTDAKFPCFVPDDGALSDSDYATYGCLCVLTKKGYEEEATQGIALLADKGFVPTDYTDTDGNQLHTNRKIEGTIYYDADMYLDETGAFNYDIYVTDTAVPADNITGDITMAGLNFGTYADTQVTVSGMVLRVANVMKAADGSIQVKKEIGDMKNANELPEIASITIVQVDKGSYTGKAVVKMGATADAMQEITAVSGVYTLTGAKYFEIANTSGFACYFTSIKLDFKDL